MTAILNDLNAACSTNNYHEAREACIKSGYVLITEMQWLAIAHDAASNNCNWTKGKVGEGKLYQGLRNNSVTCAQPGDYDPTNPKERRWLTLSNGERVCDFNGNLWQWVFDDVQGDENGLTARPFDKDSPSITTAPFPSMKKGMGWRPDAGTDWSGGALIRGGFWSSGARAGAFSLNDDWPDNRGGNVGFRCTQPIGL